MTAWICKKYDDENIKELITSYVFATFEDLIKKSALWEKLSGECTEKQNCKIS